MEAGTGLHAQLPGQAGHDQCVLAGHAVWCFRWREAGPVSVPAVHEYGPYTLYDLDALPEDGKRYELADGWLTELSPSPWHDHAAGRLKDILKNAARLAGAAVNVAGGPNDITTPAGVRKPDAFIVPRDITGTAIGGQVRTCYAGDLPLVAEVNSPAAAASKSAASAKSASTPGPGSPLLDRGPRTRSQGHHPHPPRREYALDAEIRAGHALTASQPFAISSGPGTLTELE
jgi:Putative restriction endonuclease